MTSSEPPDSHVGPRLVRRTEEFDGLYAAGTPPWDIGRPQPAFLELAQNGRLAGRVLDVGCGTGEHALMAAALGMDATGIDAAPTALNIATRKAKERSLTVRFLEWDALDLASLNEQFDTTLDSALFHVFGDDDRRRFVDSLRAAMPVGGRYYMLCFSDRQPGDWGPRRVSQAEVGSSFSDGWRVDSVEPSKMEVNIDPAGAIAWLVSATRT